MKKIKNAKNNISLKEIEIYSINNKWLPLGGKSYDLSKTLHKYNKTLERNKYE